MVAATKLGVTPRQIAEAKEIATNLCRAAFAPQEVRQPDGSALKLCLRGRLTRAYLLAGEAQRKGDEARVARLRAGIEQLAAQVQRAEAEAQRAASDYAGLCAASGMEPEDVYPPKCGCEGCELGRRQAAYFAADAELRHAVFALLLPREAHDALPRLTALLDGAGDADTRDVLWRALKRIGDAQRAYADACSAFDRAPDWYRVLCVYDSEKKGN